MYIVAGGEKQGEIAATISEFNMETNQTSKVHFKKMGYNRKTTKKQLNQTNAWKHKWECLIQQFSLFIFLFFKNEVHHHNCSRCYSYDNDFVVDKRCHKDVSSY